MEMHAVEIELNDSTVEIIPSEDAQINISYLDFAGEDKTISILSEEGSISISSQRKSKSQSITIALPVGANLELNAFNTNFNLHDLTGDIQIKTVDGDITAANMNGILALRSSRGNITVAESQGDISVLGEHGILTLNSLHGDIDASTIIGTIQFSSEIQSADDIFLETDHGPVVTNLINSDNAFINIWTTNGTVTCMLGQVEMTNITCKREPASPVGSFQIKTVWGTIYVSSK